MIVKIVITRKFRSGSFLLDEIIRIFWTFGFCKRIRDLGHGRDFRFDDLHFGSADRTKGSPNASFVGLGRNVGDVHFIVCGADFGRSWTTVESLCGDRFRHHFRRCVRDWTR